MSDPLVRYRANPRFVPDNVSIRFGGGGVASLGPDGAHLRLLLSAAASVMIGRPDAPAPDTPLHVWRTSAGNVAAPSTSVITAEGSGVVGISILTPNSGAGRLVFGDVENNAAGRIVYDHSVQGMDFYVEDVNRVRIIPGEFRFRQPHTVTTESGDLTLSPAGSLVVSRLAKLNGDGTHVIEAPADATDPTGGGGAAAGRIPIRVGGVTRYLAYY